MRTLITVAIIAILAMGAIALGVKFFTTSVHDDEDAEGWDKDE